MDAFALSSVGRFKNQGKYSHLDETLTRAEWCIITSKCQERGRDANEDESSGECAVYRATTTDGHGILHSEFRHCLGLKSPNHDFKHGRICAERICIWSVASTAFHGILIHY